MIISQKSLNRIMSLLKNPQSNKSYCSLLYKIVTNFAINFLSHNPVFLELLLPIYFLMHITDSLIQDINSKKNFMFSGGLLLRTKTICFWHKPADGSCVVHVIGLYLNSQVFFKLVYANAAFCLQIYLC